MDDFTLLEFVNSGRYTILGTQTSFYKTLKEIYPNITGIPFTNKNIIFRLFPFKPLLSHFHIFVRRIHAIFTQEKLR